MKVVKNVSSQIKMQKRDEAKAKDNWDSFYSLCKFLS